MRWLWLLAACGRVDFDAVPDAAPISVRLGGRPGATDFGGRDTYLDDDMRDARHGLEGGLACDMGDVTLIEIGLPPGPHHVLSAQVHIEVTDDKLEAGEIDVHEMLGQWSESESTWNESSGAAGMYGPTFASFDAPVTFTDHVFDVPPEVVERWWNGTSFGMAITVTASGVNFGSHEGPAAYRPELDLVYQP